MASKRTPLVVNGRFLTQPVTGVQRVAQQITLALDELACRGACGPGVVLTPPHARSMSCRCFSVSAVGRFSGQMWEQFELPRHARDGLVLNLGNTAPLFRRQQAVFIYDASIYAVP